MKEDAVSIPRIDIKTMAIRLVGDTPLICHRWSDKAKREMLQKQMKQAKQAKIAKDPRVDYLDSLYWMSTRPDRPSDADVRKTTFGFPVVAFKSAAVDACSHVAGMTKVLARGMFHIDGELVAIIGIPGMREDMVRVAMGTADIRYRAEFKAWSVILPIRFNAAACSVEQILNLFETAGFAIGVGEWRPQREGSYGMFHVARENEDDKKGARK